MQRVAVIGNAGGGKSRLSRRIAAARGLPYHAIDLLQYKSGWDLRPEFEDAHAALIAGDAWVIDGVGTWPSLTARLARADTIVFVDLPFRVHLWWATKRQVRAILFGRPDAPAGARSWPMTIKLYRLMVWVNRDIRPRFEAAALHHAGRARVVHLRSVAELNAFAGALA